MKEALPHSPSHHSTTSTNQMNSQGHITSRGGNNVSSNVMQSHSKVTLSPHHKDSANNLAKSDINIVSLIKTFRPNNPNSDTIMIVALDINIRISILF